MRAHDEAELVRLVQQHALEAHGLAFSPDEVIQLMFRAELDEPTWHPRLGSASMATPCNLDSEERRER